MVQQRDETPPFLVKVFYRTQAFHRPEEFMEGERLPPCLDIHTWRDCTLKELTELIADSTPKVLPEPPIGTRLAFRLIYRESHGQQKFATKDIGTLVIGEGRPGANPGAPPNSDRLKTLAEVRFITGDYISCAILPPNEYTGEVMPASAAKEGRGSGPGEAEFTPSASRIPTRHGGDRLFGGRSGGNRGFGYSRGGARGFVPDHHASGRRGPGPSEEVWPGSHANFER